METAAKDSVMEFASQLGVGVGFRDISLRLFRASPVLEISGLSLGAPEKTLALSSTDLSASLSWSQVVAKSATLQDITVSQSSVAIVVDESGESNWDELIDIARSLANENPDNDSNEFPVQALAKLNIQDVKVNYVNAQLAHDGNVALEGSIDLANTSSGSSLELTGDLNDYAVRVSTSLGDHVSTNSNSLRELPRELPREIAKDIPNAIPVLVEAELADLQLLVNTHVNSVLSPSKLVGNVQLSGSNISSTLHDLNLLKTDVSDGSATIRFSLFDNLLTVSEAVLEIGKSQLEATISVNGEERPYEVNGQIVSSELSLDELFGVRSPPLEIPRSTQAKTKPSTARIFSSSPFQPDTWFSQLVGNINAEFSQITRGATSIYDLRLNAMFEPGTATLDATSDRFAGGDLVLNASIDTSGDEVVGVRSSKMSLKLTQVQMLELLLSDSSAGSGKGSVSGEGTFWASGFSPSSMAASLDGGLFLVVEDGELDSMLVEMAGIDLMESINLLLKRDFQQTAIRCGYLDVQASSGVVDIQDFVIDTEDSLFLLKGGVNLNDESIALKFEPHPRDASFLAAPTALVVSGTLASPSMKPGRSLYSRIAVAGALAALTGPAAIVLPFIEIGSGGEPSNCQALFSR